MGADLSALNPIAAGAAQGLLARCPKAIITSARRSLADQARAMAENEAQAPGWVASTYAPSAAKAACVAWLSRQHACVCPSCLEAGFLAALTPLPPEELRHLSWHLSGDAFDAAPVDDEEIKAALADILGARLAAGGAGKLLTREGGLDRLHLQIC